MQMIENTGLSRHRFGRSLDDRRCSAVLPDLDEPRLDGVIIGKALYEGLIQLEEACSAVMLAKRIIPASM